MVSKRGVVRGHKMWTGTEKASRMAAWKVHLKWKDSVMDFLTEKVGRLVSKKEFLMEKTRWRGAEKASRMADLMGAKLGFLWVSLMAALILMDSERES